MATQISSLITRARDLLNEPTASFWSDAELLRYLNGGIADLYRRIKDNLQDDFFIEDSTNVSLAAGATQLTGVPANVAHVRGIRPRVLAAYPNVHFFPRKWGDADFQQAETQSALDPALGGTFFYAITGTGGPVGAPVIRVAPTVSSALDLTFAYTPSLTEITNAATVNPIPGESDMALVYWTVAHALARTPTDTVPQAPHPGWMQQYEAQAAKIGVATTPRQDDEPDYVEALFELYWS
jgi:hypothetical protein